MAIYNYNQEEFIKIIKNKDNRVAQIQEQLDTDNHVSITNIDVKSIDIHPNGLIAIEFKKEDFKCNLRIEEIPDSDDEEYETNAKTYEDCIKLHEDSINHLIGMDNGDAYINNMQIDYIKETDNSKMLNIERASYAK
jgi:hypothetical protein